MRTKLVLFAGPVVIFAALLAASASPADQPDNWAELVKFPTEEKPIKLFNGKDLNGWEGQIDKFFSVDNGAIKATNKEPVAASTYLFTKQSFRDFRLLLEIKQTRGKGYSTMHSAVCCLGEKYTDKGDPFSYKGTLVLLCDNWGFYDVNGRLRLAPPGQKGDYKYPGEKLGDWNQIEILIKGDRLRYAANGQVVVDFTDKADKLKPSPVGLQLHANKMLQEIHFRGLILSENPQDRFLTVVSKDGEKK